MADGALDSRVRELAERIDQEGDSPAVTGFRVLERASLASEGPFQRLDIENASEVQRAAVAPFLAPGDLMLVCGLKASGKTTLALDIVLGALLPSRAGNAWSGALRVEPDWFGGDSKVLLLDGEDSKERAQSKLRMLLKGSGEVSDESISLVQERVLFAKPSELGLRDAIRWTENSVKAAEMIANEGVRLVIGDTAARIWQPVDFNSADWVNKGMGPFHETLKAHGICCVLNAHHKRPGDTGSSAHGPLGTSQQENQADAMLFVSRTGPTLRIRHAKSRRSWWMPVDASIELELPTNRIAYTLRPSFRDAWPIAPQPEGEDSLDVRRAGLPPQQFDVLHVFETRPNEPISQKEISQALQINPGNVTKHCKALMDRGLLKLAPGTRLKSWMLDRGELQ